MFGNEARFRPGPRSFLKVNDSLMKVPGPGYYPHKTSTREILEGHRDRQVKSLDSVAKTGRNAQRVKDDVAKLDEYHKRLPGRKKAQERASKEERVQIQKSLLKSLYKSEKTVQLLQQIPNMRPFLKDTFSLNDEADLIIDLEGELRVRTPNIRGTKKSLGAHERPSTGTCQDLLHVGTADTHTLLAVGAHKCHWERELEAGRGPGTYLGVDDGLNKKSHNWKLQRLHMFDDGSDDDNDSDAGGGMHRPHAFAGKSEPASPSKASTTPPQEPAG
jgi:hypothetical protein